MEPIKNEQKQKYCIPALAIVRPAEHHRFIQQCGTSQIHTLLKKLKSEREKEESKNS